MAFDAGTIIAHLDLDQKSFDSKLRAAQAAADKFERDPINLKVGEIATQQQVAQARKAFSTLDNQITRDAAQRSRSSATGSVLGSLAAMGRGGSGGGGGGTRGGGGGNQGWGTGLLKGIGPGILGIGARSSLIAGGVGLAGAALPALAAGGGALGVGAIGAGAVALGAKTLIGSKQDPGPLYQQANQMMSQLKKIIQQAAGPLIAPLRKAFGEIPKLMHGLLPELRQMFAGAATLIQPLLHGLTDMAHMVLPLLGKAFRAAAPLIRPLLDGFGKLVAGLLPGLITLLHAAAPAVRAIAQVLGVLGRGVGGLLSSMAPAVKASAIVFKAIGAVVGALLPVIGKLAGIFARALAPVIVDLAKVLKALMPSLVIIGRVFASLAGAILKDLVGAFGALAKLLILVQPAIRIFATALSKVFTILENSGAFAALGTALEKIVPSLAQLVNLVARQLAPILPQLIGLLGQFADIMITLLATGLTTILQGVTALVKQFPFLVPLIAGAAAAWWLLNIAMDANPVGAVIIGIIALIGAITLLVKHWSTVWNFIKQITGDVWTFLTHGWGQYLIPGLTLIRLAVELVSKHWKQAFDDVKTAGKNLWQWLWTDFGAKIDTFFTRTAPGWLHQFGSAVSNVFTQTIPNAFRTAVKIIGQVWGNIQNAVRKPAAWVVDHVINGLISAFDWISGKVGGPNIKPVHPFGLQKGGKLPGYGGGDRHLALLESGEAVVPKEHAGSAGFAAWAKLMGIPGYQSGGKVGQAPPGVTARVGPGASSGGPNIGGAIGKIADLGKVMAAIATGNTKALTNAITSMIPGGVGGAVADMGKLLVDIPKVLVGDAVKTLIGLGGLGGKGGDIARWAMQWAGKIPYVWGGGAIPGGADCSGFVQSTYRHFGISAPRTSEGQGAWVKKGKPTIGGLALYNSPAGGPPPGHVAIVGFGGNVISQGGGMGPQIVPLHSMNLMFTGTPPGGGGLGNVGPGDLIGLERLWTGAGGPGGGVAHIAGAIGMAESGGRSVKQQGQPPGTTGWGIWQITPTSGITQNGRFGNLLNDANNARAAVSLYRQAHGFGPWVTFNDGAYRSFMDSGGYLRPGANFVQNSTGKPEAVLNPGQSQAFLALADAVSRGGSSSMPSSIERKLDLLIAATERGAARTGQAMGRVLQGAARGAAASSYYSGGR